MGPKYFFSGSGTISSSAGSTPNMRFVPTRQIRIPGVPFVAMIRPCIVKHAPTKAGLLLHPAFESMSAGRRLSPCAALASRIAAAPTAT